MMRRGRLPRSSPEARGLSSRAVSAFLDDVEGAALELHSLIVVVQGDVVAEGWWAPYGPDLPHELFSLSKSFTSTAVGFAVAEGLLDLDDLVVSHFPDKAPPEPAPHLGALTVRHLLTMTTGHHDDATGRAFAAEDWVRGFLAVPLDHEPGTWFTYNTAATYVLAALVRAVTGQRLLDYLGPRLLEPLGIEGATWDQWPEGFDMGGFGLSATTEDIACLGQLYLDDGAWHGRRVLPEGWAAAATGIQVRSRDDQPDWCQGYGFQFWRGRHGSYRGDGAFGQFCLVLPEQRAVVAMTAGVGDMQGVLDRVWNHLLPALPASAARADELANESVEAGAAVEPIAPRPSAAVQPDPAAHEALVRRLASLELVPPAGATTSAVARRLSGRTIAFEDNAMGVTSVVLDDAGEECRLSMTAAGSVVTVPVGRGRWALTRVGTPWTGPDDLVALSGVWPAPDTYVLSVQRVLTPFRLTVTVTVDGDMVRAAMDVNVAFGPTHLADLAGTVQGD